MKKSFFSAAAAGLLFLAGTGVASAAVAPLIGVGPTGVEGFLSLTGFSPGASSTPGPNTQNFIMGFDYLGGSNSGPTTLSFTSQSGPTVDLFSNTLDLKIDNSPNVDNPRDPSYVRSTDILRLQVSWQGSATVGSAFNSPLTFGDPGNPPPDLTLLPGHTISITYNGFSFLGQSYTGAGLLLLTVTGDDYNTLTFSGLDTCTSGTLAPSNVCFTRALTLIDQFGGGEVDNRLDGVFFIPEPASLALMGVGIAGLGFIRRKKAA